MVGPTIGSSASVNVASPLADRLIGLYHCSGQVGGAERIRIRLRASQLRSPQSSDTPRRLSRRHVIIARAELHERRQTGPVILGAGTPGIRNSVTLSRQWSAFQASRCGWLPSRATVHLSPKLTAYPLPAYLTLYKQGRCTRGAQRIIQRQSVSQQAYDSGVRRSAVCSSARIRSRPRARSASGPRSTGLLDAKHGRGLGPPLPAEAASRVHGRAGPGLCARVAVLHCGTALASC
jgi:hypothetical protein